jgi:tetratricopeptide (TPR) repeat protein
MDDERRTLRSPDERAAIAAARNSDGLTALHKGQLADAVAIFEEVVAAFAELGAARETSAALHNLGLVEMRRGRLPRAQEVLDAALDLAPAGDHQDSGKHEADVRVTAGALARRRGDPQAATDHYRRARELYERYGFADDVLDVRLNMAVLAERSGRLTEAQRELTEIRARILLAVSAHLSPSSSADADADELGAGERRLAAADTTLSAVAAQQGRFAEAAALLEEAEAIYRRMSLPRELADVLTNQGYVYLHVGDYARSRQLLQRALGMFTAMGMELDSARLLGGLAGLERRTGNYAGAAAAYQDALETYRGHGLDREATDTQLNIGVVKCAQEEWTGAIEILLAAQVSAIGGSDATAASIEQNLGVAYAGAQDWDRAREHYTTAQEFFRQAGQQLQVAELDMNLGIVAAACGDLPSARRCYARAQLGYRRLGLWTNVARCLHNDGLTWPGDTPQRRERILPAWLALEAARFTFRLPSERALWREEIGKHAAAAFDAANLSPSPVLLAEVIERARAIGSLDLARPGALETLTPEASPASGAGLPSEDDLMTGSADEDDALTSLPVTSAVAVECAPSSELAPFTRQAQEILDLRGAEPDTVPGLPIRLADDVIAISAVLI